MPDLPFQGAIRLRSIKDSIKNKHHEDIIEHTGTPNSEEESFPNIKELKYPNLQELAEDESLSIDNRGEYAEEEKYEDNENTSFLLYAWFLIG